MGTLLILLIIALYFIPTIAGIKTKQATAIFLLNLLLGWTIIGWIGALIWAFSLPEEKNVTYWLYKCTKCGYQREIDQKITLFKCPQCGHENPYR
jgi:DNA-directed RNA polymerase, subunit RPC10 (contains C4-type Zn-finger)